MTGRIFLDILDAILLSFVHLFTSIVSISEVNNAAGWFGTSKYFVMTSYSFLGLHSAVNIEKTTPVARIQTKAVV